MRKYVVIIVIIGVLLAGVLIFNTIMIEKESQKIFQDSGYVLQNASERNETQNVERYYFNAEETYKEKYEQKVIFKNTEGEEVVANLNNFIHYSDGSVSAFKNGVLLNLNDIDAEPIRYYNIAAGKILNKQGSTYTINNLDQELVFNNVIWKISEQKYLILGENIRLVFDDGTQKDIQGYVELEYLDNEIVKIYNQEATYQTISSRAYIELPDEIRINLSTRIVSKQNSNKMSLDNMVIDSDDNITIVNIENQEIETEDISEANAQETQEGETTQEQGGTQNSQTTTNNSQTVINGDMTTNTIGDNSQIIDDGNIGTGEEIQTTKTPVFKVESLEANSLGIEATITIEDEDNTLISDTNIYILKNSTGKTVYQYTESMGVYNIDLSISTLEPDQEYTLVAEATYRIDDMEYTRNFIYKIFRTTPIGMSLEKDVFTPTSLGVAVSIDRDTKVRSAEIVLQDTSGNRLQTQTILNGSTSTSDKKEIVEFAGLTPNTQYIVSITNVLYDGQVITNGFESSVTFTTLKQTPTVSGTAYEINKRDGNFVLKLQNVEDLDKGIQSYQFQIHDTRMTEGSDPIQVIESDNTQITVSVDEVLIHRNVGYTFKVIAIFNDNEKICEYESELSAVFKMDGVEFPTIRFEEKEVTYERIEGNIIVEDNGKTIDLANGNFFEITYTDSVGVTKSFTSQGSYTIPVSVNNLRANETYKFAVYTTVDLQDGNDPIDKCYIGGIVVQTGIPQNMQARFAKVEDDVKNAFNVIFKLEPEKEDQGTLEPETLTGMTISIYAGQTVDGELPTGSPLRTVKLVDSNTQPYESVLKQEYYDKTAQITPEFFNARNEDFRDSYYTIVVSQGYDYTDYKNALPIINNIFTVQTNGYMPDLPTDVNNALTVTPIRNYTSENKREELDDSTIVGYNVTAVYDNNGLYAKEVIYRVYDANTNQLIDTKTVLIGEDGVIPTVKFDVLDGTPIDVVDEDGMHRGNSYFFAYEMILDLNKDGVGETRYPYEEDTILKSRTQSPSKQTALIYMYPSVSTNDTITFKYKYQDVDNAVANDRRVTARINNGTIGTQTLVANAEGQEVFNEMNFVNLSKGELTLIITEALMKTSQNDRIIVDQYFEGFNTVTDVQYRIDIDTNKVSISFMDNNDQLKYIAGVRVEFLEKTDSDDGIKVIKDFKTIPDNKILSIDYNDLGDLLEKTTIVNVYAYYDSGITGFDTDRTKYVTYQKAYKKATDPKYYYTINQEGKFVENTSITGNIYATQRTENQVSLENKCTNRTANIEITYGEDGFNYQGDVILQKQLEETLLNHVDSNEIYFDLIIPGISLKDENDNWTIDTELDKVHIKGDLLVHPETLLQDKKIYIDLYQTDEEYRAETFLRTIEVITDDFDDVITIENLTPKSYYFIKFRTKINQDDGSVIDADLYDIDYQVSGRQYYFSTLANVNINNIQVAYNPVDYEEKYLDITYTLERITGYTRIEYNLYHYNKETQTYDKIMNIEPDLIFNNEMKKQIAINPGSGFIFGDEYKLEILPLAEYTAIDGQETILELGRKEQVFTLDKLQNPVIAVNGSREETDDSIVFKVTVYDDDKVIEGNKYSIKIVNAQLEDITPEEYKKEYSVEEINNTITLNDVDTDQSYTIIVTSKVDLDNDKTDLVDFSRQFTIPAVNRFGISLGTVTANKNTEADNKIDLFFNNSYKLLEIDEIRYSIYNTNGYAQSGKEEFVPRQIQSGGETYYAFTIDKTLTTYEKYYIELQFLKDGEIVETLSLEYVYLQN